MAEEKRSGWGTVLLILFVLRAPLLAQNLHEGISDDAATRALQNWIVLPSYYAKYNLPSPVAGRLVQYRITAEPSEERIVWVSTETPGEMKCIRLRLRSGCVMVSGFLDGKDLPQFDEHSPLVKDLVFTTVEKPDFEPLTHPVKSLWLEVIQFMLARASDLRYDLAGETVHVTLGDFAVGQQATTWAVVEGSVKLATPFSLFCMDNESEEQLRKILKKPYVEFPLTGGAASGPYYLETWEGRLRCKRILLPAWGVPSGLGEDVGPELWIPIEDRTIERVLDNGIRFWLTIEKKQ